MKLPPENAGNKSYKEDCSGNAGNTSYKKDCLRERRRDENTIAHTQVRLYRNRFGSTPVSGQFFEHKEKPFLCEIVNIPEFVL